MQNLGTYTDKEWPGGRATESGTIPATGYTKSGATASLTQAATGGTQSGATGF